MFNIADYLNKFKNVGFAEMAAKDGLIAEVKNILGADIERKDIKIRGGIAYISANPIIKNSLVIKKSDLLDRVSKITDKIKDIK